MVIDPDPGPGKPDPNVLAVCSLSARSRYCHLSRAEVVGAPDNQPFSMLSAASRQQTACPIYAKHSSSSPSASTVSGRSRSLKWPICCE